MPLRLAVLTLATATTALRQLAPSVVTPEGAVRYFAFGSNLDPAKMAVRGSNSSAIAYVRRWRCVAPGYRLAFTMRGFPPLEPAMASVEPSDAGSCPGCVYEMDRDAYEALWKSEGGAMERRPYGEIVVKVVDDDGREMDAITLAAEPWARLKRDGLPSARYLGIIETGARSLGLEAYADELARAPRVTPSKMLRSVASAHGVISIICFRCGLRRLLAPIRVLCFALAYGGRNPWRKALSEAATAAVLLPTALVGAATQAVRRVFRLKPITFAPPSDVKTSKL